jgi:Tol biopolymer transport system component
MDVAMVDREGAVAPLRLPPAAYEFPRVSPDGKRLAVQKDDGRQANVWIYDLSGSSSLRRLTNAGRNTHPIWSHDSQRVAFQSDREGDSGIFWQPSDGSGTAERLTKSEPDVEHIPQSWSPDGQYLLFAKSTKAGASTLWTLSLSNKTASRFGDLEALASNLVSAVFSPDGRLVAYGQGLDGVFVQPFPPTGPATFVDVGIHPVWSGDGKELLYRQRGVTFAVSVTTKPAFTFGKPAPVKMGSYRQRGPTVARELDPAPDGKRFAAVVLANTSPADTVEAKIQVVVNWFEELKQRAPIPK